MAKSPYTQKHVDQFRGPADSESFNKNSEDIYQDLVYLHNKANELSSDVAEGFSAALKDIYGISREIEDLRAEIAAIKATSGSQLISYAGAHIDDTDRFANTAYEISDIDKLVLDSRFKLVTLPKVIGSSVSKLKYTGVSGEISIPPSLEMVVAPKTNSLDNGAPETIVRTSLPYEAVVADPGRVWERNVISDDPNGQVSLDLMFSLPTELTSTPLSNVIEMIPFPLYGVDIIGIYYSTDPAPVMSADSPEWIPLNDASLYTNDDDAVGKIPPGAWSGDAILESYPLSFVFPSKRITAFKIALRQTNPFNLTSDLMYPKYIYSYGISTLDVRYDKFADSGKVIFRLDPNTGDTISSVENVTPFIYNVAQAAISDVFSYQIIWETSPDSGIYTLTPVPSSEKAWIEITLMKDDLDNLPALNGFVVEYS
jgi:hypothetical protein